MDVWQNTTGSDGYVAQKLVQLLVVAHSELYVARDDAALLVVASSVTCKLQDLSAQVLKHSSKVYWCSSSYTGSELSLLQEAANTTHWELQSSLS